MEWIFYYEPPGEPSWVVIGEDGSGPGNGGAPPWPKARGFSNFVGDMSMGVERAGPRLHDLNLAVGYSGIGSFFSTIGKAIGKGFKWVGTQAWQRRETIAQWVTQAGGPGSFGDACIYDPQCQKYYILELASGSVTGVREARQGECVGKRIVDASSISGWVSSCGVTWPWETGAVAPTGFGPAAGPGFEYYLQKYGWIPITGIVLLVVAKMWPSRQRSRA